MMDIGGLEASQHADTTHEGGLEKRPQLQQLLQSKVMLKLQPKLRHEPKPKIVPGTPKSWATVPPRAKC
jgi:hypothetical protein